MPSSFGHANVHDHDVGGYFSSAADGIATVRASPTIRIPLLLERMSLTAYAWSKPLLHGEGAFHVGVEDAVVRVGPRCGGGREGGRAGFDDEVKRGGSVGGEAVGFDVFVGNGDGCSGANRLGVLVFEAFDQDLSGGCRRGVLTGG